MKRNITRKLFCLLLCLVMLVGILPATHVHADYEDGMECWNCDHYHYDEWCCGSCGACSADDSNVDCFVATHCNECGACFREASNFCPDCRTCEDCYVNNGWHCLSCNECHFTSEEELCGKCWFCGDCMGGLCDGCGFCEGCWGVELMHCEECGNCYGEYDICQYGYIHCEECCIICEQCDECLYEDGIELCDDCGLCIFCCMDNAESEGCGCGEYCIESADWHDHLCPDCGNAYCEVEMCDLCELCLDCCEGNTDCVESPPICVEDPEYEFHFCQDCGDCFHNSHICESCEAAGTLLCENCCEIRLEEEGCDCSDRCISDSDLDAHIASAHLGADGAHSATPRNSWEISDTQHWRACRFCEESGHFTSKSSHTYDKYGICTVCGFDSQKTILILKQPQSVVAKVSDQFVSLPDEPLFPTNNLRTFSVAAKGTSALNYQWYVRYGASDWKALSDITGDISGAKTNTLTVSVPIDACYEDYAYKCVITDARGNTVTSNTAYLKAQHVYRKYASQKGALVDTIFQPGTGNNIGVYESDGHYVSCVGDGCEEDKFEPHSFSKETRIVVDSKDGTRWVERSCIHCGFVGYILDHDHYFYDPATYECQVDATYKNENQHRLKCLWPGCTKTTLEEHDWLGWQNHGTPYSSGDNLGIAYQECQICGYSSNKELETYSSVQDKMVTSAWTKTTDLVFVEGGYASCDTVVNGTKLIIGFAPSAYYKDAILNRQNPKITGWKVHYYCDRRPSGSVVDLDVTAYFTLTKLGNELKWSVTVPAFTGRTGGGILTFIPVLAAGECPHTGGTRIKGATDPICTKDGYTGDTVCCDCEGVVTYGEIIEGGKEHTGNLTLIAGTAKEGTCTSRGYEGTYRCDHCNQKVRGKSTGKAHSGKTVIKNAKAFTCTEFGYSGDTYCECGVLLKEGEILVPRHTDLRLIGEVKANCQRKGYTGDWICYDCDQYVKYGYNVPKTDHAWSLWGSINDQYHRHTCVVAGCGAQETSVHTDADRDLICDDCSYSWIPSEYLLQDIAFNIDIPDIGATPDYTKFDSTGFASEGTGTYIKNGVQWFDVTANQRFVPGGVNQQFQEGHIYKVTIDFRTKGEYEFADEGALTATINGQTATIEYVTYGTFASISYTFPALVHKHSMTRTNKVSPTCTATGKQAYYHCDSCNGYFEDAAGQTPISNITTWGTIAKKSHTYKTVTTKATLTNDGSIVSKCGVCGHTASTTAVKAVKTITLSATSYTYDATAKTPAVTVKDSAGKTLTKGTDYTVTYASGRTEPGTYTVTVKLIGNYSGTKELTFTVSAAATKITTQPKTQKVKAGATAKYTVKATGIGLSYQWQSSSDGKTWKNCSSSSATKATFTFTSKTSHSSNYYRCKITDAKGKTEYTDAVRLYVLGITTQPKTLKVKAGTTAKYTVKATGAGKTYQWQSSADGKTWKNCSSSSATSATFTFTSKTSHNGNYYRCRIKDNAGNTVYTAKVKLTVKK